MIRTLVYMVVLLVWVNSARGQTKEIETPAENGIERILAQERDMVFDNATLKDLASFLIASGIPTYFDQRALDDIGTERVWKNHHPSPGGGAGEGRYRQPVNWWFRRYRERTRRPRRGPGVPAVLALSAPDRV